MPRSPYPGAEVTGKLRGPSFAGHESLAMVRTRLAVASLATLAFTSVAAPAHADVFADLEAKLDQQMDAPGENVFPEPQDEALARIKFEPDQVLWLFRQARASAHRKTTGGGVDLVLADALAQKHARHAWVLTRRLRESLEGGKDRPVRQFARAVREPPLPEDRAAFAPIFERLPAEMRGRFADAEAAAREAAASLEDPDRLARYVTRCEAEPDFYRRRGWLARQGKKVAKGVEGLVDRLELRFSKENLLRFFARLAGGSRHDKVQQRSRKALSSLQSGLLEAVVRDLDDQLEGGLGERVQSIELVSGGIRTKTALTRGRLRIVMKLMAALEDQPEDLRLFLPTLKGAHRAVKQRRRAARDEAAKYLERLDQTLEHSLLIHQIRARKSGSEAPEFPVLDAIWRTLKAEDFEGLFAELAKDPDLI